MKRVVLAIVTVMLMASAVCAADKEWFFNPANGDVIEGPVGSSQHYINLGTHANASAAQAAARRFAKIPGTIQAIQGSMATFRADDGRTLTVDLTPLGTPGHVKAGDRMTLVGAPGASRTQWTAHHLLDVKPGAGAPAPAVASATDTEWFFNPGNGDVVAGPVGSPQNYINLGRHANASAAQAATRRFQKIAGTIDAIQGTMATFRADDGRILTVDLMPVGTTGRVKAGDRTIIVASPGASTSQWTAHYVLDVKAGAGAPAPASVARASGPDWFLNPNNADVIPGPVGSSQHYINLGPQPNAAAAQAAAKALRSVRGQVQSVHARGITLKTDDGRLLAIDTAQLDRGLQGRLAAGQTLTVYGRYVNDPGHFSASFAQEDGGAASPSSR